MKEVAFDLKNINNLCLLVSSQEPFFGYLLSGISIEIGKFEGITYMACTSSCIKIQEDYVDEVQKDVDKLKEFVVILLHEVYHICLHHPWRYGFTKCALYNQHLDKADWLAYVINIVLDAIINTSLLASKYNFGSLNYVSLKDVLPPNHPRNEDNSWNEDELLLEVLKNTTAKQAACNGGGEGQGGKYKYIISLPSGKQIDTEEYDMDVITSEDEQEAKQKADEIKSIAKKAAEDIRSNNKNAGKIGANLLPPEIEETCETNISWEDRLRQVAEISLTNNVITNYQKVLEENFFGFKLGINSFNRCPIEYPYIPLPEPNTVAVFIDLSGSIYGCPDTLSKFLFQITEIANYVGNLLLVTFDVGVTGCSLFNMSELDKPLGQILLEQKEKYLLGGGGTDVIPLFEEFEESFSKHNVDVDINNICMLIVLTDLWLEAVPARLEPKNSKGMVPTIWAVCEDYAENNKINFGELLIIE